MWKLISLLGVNILLNTLFVLSAEWHTAEENKAIDKFRPLVADKLTVDYMKKDGFLLRYLKASKFDMNISVALMEKTHKWRQAHDVDNIFKEDLSSHRQSLPSFNEGFDREGRPIFELLWGKWDLRKYDLAGKRSVIFNKVHQSCEHLEERIFKSEEELKRDIGQHYVIVDFNGFSLRKQACLGCIPVTLDLARAFDSIYTVNSKNLTLINVPRSFTPVLVLIKEIFGERGHIMTHYGADKKEWEPELLKDIATDQLSSYLGGTRPNSALSDIK